MSDDRYISQTGLDKLKVELKNIHDIIRPEIVSRIETAKELGDLSENAEYHDAKDQLALIDARVSELSEMINFAVVVEKTSGSIIGIGSKIRVRVGDKERRFQLVGTSESDPSNGKISNESPLGQALFGQMEGQLVKVETPSGTVKYDILEVN